MICDIAPKILKLEAIIYICSIFAYGFGASAWGQEPVRLETVENVARYEESPDTNEDDERLEPALVLHIDDRSQEVSDILGRLTSARVSDAGNRLQRQSFAFRGAGSQDIVVRYMGVPLNALSDAGADLSLIPAPLLGSTRTYGSGASATNGAVGGLVDLHPHNPDSMQVRLSVSSMHDFSLFSQACIKKSDRMVNGSLWGDISPGRFQYLDAQGTRQIREHNEAHRVGGQVLGTLGSRYLDLTAFSLFSHIERQEAGMSEFPSKYRDAAQTVWLSLSGLKLRLAPFSLGKSLVLADLSMSERVSGDVYDNPTAFIGGARAHSKYLESRTQLDSGTDFLVGAVSRTSLRLAYDFQFMTHEMLAFQKIGIQTHDRHILSATIREGLSLAEDTLQIAASLRLDWDTQQKPLYSPHITVVWRPLDGLSLRASGSMAERYPTFDESYYRTEFMRGTPTLKPQRGHIHELGVSYSPASWLNASVTGFYNLHRNLIRFIPLTPYFYESANIGAVVSRGIEISLASSWFGFDIKTDYSLVDAATEDGFPMPTSAKHHVMAQIDWSNSNLRAGLELAYQSEVPRNMAGTDFAPARLRVNLHGSMRLGGGWALSMGILNLLNDMSSSDVLQRPLPGRHAFVRLTHRGQSE